MIATNAPLVLEQMASDRQHHRQAAARSYRLSRLARGRSAGGAPAESRPARTATAATRTAAAGGAPRATAAVGSTRATAAVGSTRAGDAADATVPIAGRASLAADVATTSTGKVRLERYASLL
jgi:hypothetical protein